MPAAIGKSWSKSLPTAFAEHGGNASLEDIARQAGVGIGTLYRHFPTREHLVEVVYRREVEALCAPRKNSHRTMRRTLPWRNGCSVSLTTSQQSAAWRTVCGYSSTRIPKFLPIRQVWLRWPCSVLSMLPIADGSVRSDIDINDISQALSGIYSAPDTPDWRDRSRRLVSLLMDGLRWGSAKSRR